MKEQNNDIGVKRCNICNQDKNIIEFRKRKEAKDGFTYSCRTCLKQQDKNNYMNSIKQYKNYWDEVKATY